ncbi:MAG TPA: ferritin family protein [Myxococcaceae bacterium]|nr:ferritin family protein [Myxococcaceae bacterium]
MTPVTGIDFARITLRDALDLAVLIEEEARDRYLEFAEQLSTHATPEVADFFARMARIEERHRTELLARRNTLFGSSPSTVERRQIFDVEAPGYEEARAFMGVRQALETVLASEVKAHAFFSEALPRVKDPELKALFQELRDEEVHHQALVKVELARCPEEPDESEAYADDPVAQ